MEGVSAEQVVEGAGGASPQQKENQAVQLQAMETSQSQGLTTGASKRRAQIQLTPNSMEGYISGLRSLDGDQAVEHTACDDGTWGTEPRYS